MNTEQTKNVLFIVYVRINVQTEIPCIVFNLKLPI